MADGRIATLVGYVAPDAAGGRRRRLAPGPEPARAGQAPLAAPPVRKLAKDLGVDLRDVQPSRADGVISRVDVESAVELPAEQSPVASVPRPAPVEPAYDPATRERRVPIKGVRRATAAAMVSSAFTAPHVTEFLTVDVTETMSLRDRLRSRRDFAEVKITPLAFAARAVCLAARRTPEVNAVWDADHGEIVYKEYVHLGIAAATPRGLMVPNVKDADRLGLRDLAVALSTLADTARAGKTPPGDMLGGTFTITNVGVFGIDTGTPIINPGESAILALGSIKDAPWVVDGQLAVRKVCQLALSFDHRVVDGSPGLAVPRRRGSPAGRAGAGSGLLTGPPSSAQPALPRLCDRPGAALPAGPPRLAGVTIRRPKRLLAGDRPVCETFHRPIVEGNGGWMVL